ncbi:MAG: ABC transporter substrate-binding protein, partial [Deltaproteobacteria bacterium]
MRRSRKGAGETPRYRCRSFGAILLLLFLLPLWGGCRGEGRGRNPKEIVVGLEATPGTLDPRFIVDAHADRIEKIVYDGLVRRDPKGAFIPGLAERWEALSPTRYRFHLRRGVHFHDGTPFSAADVKATYESILDPRTQSPRISAFEKIEHIEVIDPHTVEIVLEEPFAPILTSLVVGIMPAHATKGKGGPPIGTGPFIFEGEARGQWLRFRANRDYWGGSPAIERVTFKIIPDDAARILELEKGRIDLLQNNVP